MLVLYLYKKNFLSKLINLLKKRIWLSCYKKNTIKVLKKDQRSLIIVNMYKENYTDKEALIKELHFIIEWIFNENYKKDNVNF